MRFFHLLMSKSRQHAILREESNANFSGRRYMHLGRRCYLCKSRNTALYNHSTTIDMRRSLPVIILLLACQQFFPRTVTAQRAPLLLPGKGKIDVEQLIKPVNPQMDISRLNLLELKVLRNSLAARQGYMFTTGEMRGIFAKTTWWKSLALKRLNEPALMPPLGFTPEQQAFADRLKAREDELQTQNYKAKKGQKVNMANLLNTHQLAPLSPTVEKRLAKDGFAIVEAGHDRLTDVYRANDEELFPSFVTTDVYLHLFSRYTRCLLAEAEQEVLCGKLEAFCSRLHSDLTVVVSSSKNETMRAAAEWNQAFVAIAVSLLTNKPMPAVARRYERLVGEEMMNILKGHDTVSEFLGHTTVPFAYSRLNPQAHYATLPTLQRYYRAMKWLEGVGFATDDEGQMRRAALLASVVYNDDVLIALYQQMEEALTMLTGDADNVSIGSLYDVMKRQHLTSSRLMSDEGVLKAFMSEVNHLAEQLTRLRPTGISLSRNTVSLMPRRYRPDDEVMQKMVAADIKPPHRDVPDGLDIFAAMGVASAERILTTELKHNKQWKLFTPTLTALKQTMRKTRWDASLGNSLLQALATMSKASDDYPYFMHSAAWEKKNLNTALASWAEQRIFAKPLGAPSTAVAAAMPDLPAPVMKGYVEPNTAFWEKMLDVIALSERALLNLGIKTGRAVQATQIIKEQTQRLLSISQKELCGQDLGKEDYDYIRTVGSTFDDLARFMLPISAQIEQGQSSKTVAEGSMAAIAGVYPSPSAAKDGQSSLYAGLGNADEIYVVVEIGGWLYVARGAVFSYRQLKHSPGKKPDPAADRQMMLRGNPAVGRPQWMSQVVSPRYHERHARAGLTI